jgi:hypothetical protein
VDKLSRSGLEIDLPDGWDGRIYQRQAEAGVTTRRGMHAASFALPPTMGDYATAAVEQMQASDLLVTLIEFDPASAGSGLFRNDGMPTALGPDDFSPTAMPRAVPGRTAAQYFFSAGGRAFCLYVVLGSHTARAALLPLANAVVGTIKIDR